jgi:chemotaxis response regulator CheB
MIELEAGVSLEVVGEAADGQEAIRMAGALKPDLVLLALMILLRKASR